MPYDSTQLSRIASQYDGAWSQWAYRSEDALTDITAAGYITDAAPRYMRRGDVVFAVTFTDQNVGLFSVTAVNADTGAATLTLIAGGANPFPAQRIPGAPLPMAFVGDSLYARSCTLRDAGVTDTAWSAHGPWGWFRIMAGRRVALYIETSNFAIGGTTIADSVTNPEMVLAAVAAVGYGGLVVYAEGTNTFVADNIPWGQDVIDDMDDVLRICRAGGAQLVVVTPAARDDYGDPDAEYSFFAYRRWLFEWGRVNGVKIIDRFTVFLNPATGAPRTGYLTDGLHQATLGAVREAQLYMRELAEYMPPEIMDPGIVINNDIAPGTVPYPNPYGVLLDAGMLNTNGGTITAPATGTWTATGDIAGSWTFTYIGSQPLSGSVVLSKALDPNGYTIQRITFTNMAGGTYREVFSFKYFQSNASGRWAAGDVIEGQATVAISGTPRSVNYQLVYNNGSGGITITEAQRNLVDDGSSTYGNIPSDPPLAGLWITDRMTLAAETSAGASTLREEFLIWIDTTLGDNTVVIDISRVGAIIVPTAL